jgi:hypothetical protein
MGMYLQKSQSQEGFGNVEIGALREEEASNFTNMKVQVDKTHKTTECCDSSYQFLSAYVLSICY